MKTWVPNEKNENLPEQKNTQLVKHEKVEGTPFFITGNDEEGYILRMGAYKLTEKLPSIDDVYDQLAETQWDIIFKLISTMIEINEKYLKEKTITDEDLQIKNHIRNELNKITK